MLAQMLLPATSTFADTSSSTPLNCFTELPASDPSHENTCLGGYPEKFAAITDAAGCATQCLSEMCTSFVWGTAQAAGPKCRISHTCTVPTDFLNEYDGYFRNATAAGCAPGPKPPTPTPPTPTPPTPTPPTPTPPTPTPPTPTPPTPAPGPSPMVTMYPNYNQALNVMVSKSTSYGGTIKYLGTFDQGAKGTAQCQAACLASKTRCWSFVHIPTGRDESSEKRGGGFAGECFAVISPGFNPSYDTTAVSGVIDWPCRDDEDCSLNGKCTSGTCVCRPAWTGDRCEQLNLLPATRGAGYRGINGGHNTSSWGGSVLKGTDGTYHMWAAEITQHCGIGAWLPNSHIIHATSPTAGGSFTKKDTTWEVFAHEPEVVPGPDGEYVMFFTFNPKGPNGTCNCCRPGHGPCDGSTGKGDCPKDFVPSSHRPVGDGSQGQFSTWMSYTNDPNGKWSAPEVLFPKYHSGDSNFAPIILKDGSLVAMWRHWGAWQGGKQGGSRQFLATATDWKDPKTYIQHEVELFPDLGTAGTEDQFLYIDDDGNYHAVFHHMYGTGSSTQWWLDATGGHAFSRNGFNWTYTGVSWGNATARYNTPAGQGAHIKFSDGSETTFTRLERPHLVFATNELKGDPIFLTNSAQYGTGTNPGTASNNDDACYTLIQPVNQK